MLICLPHDAGVEIVDDLGRILERPANSFEEDRSVDAMHAKIDRLLFEVRRLNVLARWLNAGLPPSFLADEVTS
jgi:hypothetical protein